MENGLSTGEKKLQKRQKNNGTWDKEGNIKKKCKHRPRKGCKYQNGIDREVQKHLENRIEHGMSEVHGGEDTKIAETGNAERARVLASKEKIVKKSSAKKKERKTRGRIE